MNKPVIKYMHTTLDQIRKEERASYAWRESKGFETRSSYNYVRVKVS